MKIRCGLDISGDTDLGCVRGNNEDNFTIDENLGLLAVADGMGGHNSGEVASALAVTTVRDFALQMIGGAKAIVPEGGDESRSVRARQLEYFIKTANTLIYEKGRAFPKDAGMGTTVVAVLADEKSLTVAHVGDSRLYLFRRAQLTQLTEDHSLVGDQMRKGLITAEAASHSSLQNILTRALGAEAEVQVDIAEHPLLPGDLLLLASDGLTRMISDDAIARAIAEEAKPHKAVSRLIQEARAAGGLDNITVVAARVPAKRGMGGLTGLVSRIFGS